MKFKSFCHLKKEICSVLLSGCLDNPFLPLTLNTGSLAGGKGSETCCLSVLEWACCKLTQRGFLFCQNLIFRDGYFSSFQYSYLTASSCSMRVTKFFALASLVQWIECQPTDWRLTILVKGLYLGCRLPTQVSCRRQPIDVSLTWMYFSLPVSCPSHSF